MESGSASQNRTHGSIAIAENNGNVYIHQHCSGNCMFCKKGHFGLIFKVLIFMFKVLIIASSSILIWENTFQ
jgi:hypothetical protein